MHKLDETLSTKLSFQNNATFITFKSFQISCDVCIFLLCTTICCFYLWTANFAEETIRFWDVFQARCFAVNKLIAALCCVRADIEASTTRNSRFVFPGKRFFLANWSLLKILMISEIFFWIFLMISCFD